MNGITSNPALDAYQRMAVTQVGAPRAPQQPAAAEKAPAASSDQQIAKVSISSEARQLAIDSTQGSLDPQKLGALKAAMDSNQLKFDSTKIAERLVAALG